MSINTFISINNLDTKDAFNILKRINRVMPEFYNLVDQSVNMNLLGDTNNMLVLLNSKYSLLTTINTIQFIISLYNYYEPNCPELLEYQDIENDLLSIYENPKSYSKMTLGEIEEFIEAKIIDFTKQETSYTKTRNLLLLALLSQYPLKLNELVNIKYISYEGAEFEEVFPSQLGIVKRDSEFYLVRNGKTIIEQKVDKIEYTPLHRVLMLYLSRFSRGTTLLSGIGGCKLTKSNISNGLVNFTRSELGYALSIHDVRNLHNSTS
jgi:hypothetical protein